MLNLTKLEQKSKFLNNFCSVPQIWILRTVTERQCDDNILEWIVEHLRCVTLSVGAGSTLWINYLYVVPTRMTVSHWTVSEGKILSFKKGKSSLSKLKSWGNATRVSFWRKIISNKCRPSSWMQFLWPKLILSLTLYCIQISHANFLSDDFF